MSAQRYRIGDWFAVPLRDGGFGVGIVARASRGGVLLGYFFGPKRFEVPALAELAGLTAADAVLVRQFGHLGLKRGDWPVLGRRGNWDPDDWPMPVFIRYEQLIWGRLLLAGLAGGAMAGFLFGGVFALTFESPDLIAGPPRLGGALAQIVFTAILGAVDGALVGLIAGIGAALIGSAVVRTKKTSLATVAVGAGGAGGAFAGVYLLAYPFLLFDNFALTFALPAAVVAGGGLLIAARWRRQKGRVDADSAIDLMS